MYIHSLLIEEASSGRRNPATNNNFMLSPLVAVINLIPALRAGYIPSNSWDNNILSRPSLIEEVKSREVYHTLKRVLLYLILYV